MAKKKSLEQLQIEVLKAKHRHHKEMGKLDAAMVKANKAHAKMNAATATANKADAKLDAYIASCKITGAKYDEVRYALKEVSTEHFRTFLTTLSSNFAGE